MSGAHQRLRGAWSGVDRDQRFAAIAAAALLFTMFLPWYEKNVFDKASGRFVTDTVSAFGVISFIEAAIFLVAAGVILLVALRGEGRAFHLPGGDGTVIFAAGLWAALLIFYRVFDRPEVSGTAGTVGIQWGFFAAFVAAGALAYVGQRIRLAGRPEPPATTASSGEPDDLDLFEPAEPGSASERAAARRRSTASTAIVPSSEAVTDVATTPERSRGRALSREDAQQLTFDEPGDPPLRPDEAPPARDRG